MALALALHSAAGSSYARGLLEQSNEAPLDQNREGERTTQIAVPARCLSVTCPAARTRLVAPYLKDATSVPPVLPTAEGQLMMLLPSQYLHHPAAAIASKLVHTCSNYYKASLTLCAFHPQSSRVWTANKNGELAWWEINNGFKFVRQWSAHLGTKVTALRWSHSEQYCLTGDQNGYVKYWKPQGEPYRLGMDGAQIHPDGGILGLAWAPTDTKFASASEDSALRVWDFRSCKQHVQLAGHAGDCTTVDWHPSLALLASGSRDTLIKLWDARSGKHVTTYHGHQDRVSVVRFHRNGNWLLSGSKDASCRLFELRMNRELQKFTGHGKDVTTVAWHPLQEQLFATGSADSNICYWFTDSPSPAREIADAHGGAVNHIAWHPVGHLLCSVGADTVLKFWARARPGDILAGTLATTTVGSNQQVEPTPPGNLAPAPDLQKAAIPGLSRAEPAPMAQPRPLAPLTRPPGMPPPTRPVAPPPSRPAMPAPPGRPQGGPWTPGPPGFPAGAQARPGQHMPRLPVEVPGEGAGRGAPMESASGRGAWGDGAGRGGPMDAQTGRAAWGRRAPVGGRVQSGGRYGADGGGHPGRDYHQNYSQSEGRGRWADRGRGRGRGRYSGRFDGARGRDWSQDGRGRGERDRF